MSSATARLWAKLAGVYLAALWITKPITTGGREFVPTAAAHALMLAIVLVMGVVLFLADRSCRSQSLREIDPDPVQRDWERARFRP